MSFKREGDDHLWLNVIKKRRISELFSFDIPEDEAHLMKNGRFACMVCFHRPVFDTIDMMAVHRGGKKHTTCAEQFHGQKQDLEDLKRKREHENFLKTGKYSALSDLKLGTSTLNKHHKLLPSGPYDSRHRKKLMPNERKPILNLEGMSPPTGPTGATCSTSLPGNRPETPYQTISDYKKGQLGPERQRFNLNPYVKKNSEGFPTNWIHSQCIATVTESSAQKAGPSSDFYPVGDNNTISQSGLGQNLPSTKPSLQTSNKSKKQTTQDRKPAAQKPALSQEKINQAQKYLQARGSGWKKDLSGQWIRDEEAEFDSDEEPPDLP